MKTKEKSTIEGLTDRMAENRMLEARETSKAEEFENSGGGTGPGSKTRHQPDVTKYKYSTIRNHGRRFDRTSHQQLKNMTDITIQNVDNT